VLKLYDQGISQLPGCPSRPTITILRKRPRIAQEIVADNGMDVDAGTG
jgi:hypothetical protein